MRVYKDESDRLKAARHSVRSRFPDFGINKAQELERLLYEISKRDNSRPEDILPGDGNSYDKVKAHLLGRRYRRSFLSEKGLRPYLPKLELSKSDVCDRSDKKFYPKNVFIEKAAGGTYLEKRFRDFFPLSRFQEIASLKKYLSGYRDHVIQSYNKRRDTVFITKERYDLFKKCPPLTKNALCCGYHIFNLGFGCIFDCSYCFLQEYTNSPGLILPANIDDFFKSFASYKRCGMRMGTGEFTDSLALDAITEYSLPIIDFFRKHPSITFEFKTKSTEIGNILKAGHSSNIVISWSVNPESIVKENELHAPAMGKRLEAAKKCVAAGYRIGFHFDPVIYSKGWEKEYELLIDSIFAAIKPRDIAWISIGTFRFAPRLKQVIERRFPENKILDEELIFGYDNKLRYPKTLRLSIYRHIIKSIRMHSGNVKIYLCMEELPIWKALRLKMPELI